jgi:hypothetical protein
MNSRALHPAAWPRGCCVASIKPGTEPLGVRGYVQNFWHLLSPDLCMTPFRLR